MAKIFYDHLVIREELTAEIDSYNLSADDREELIRLMDETLHSEIINVILTNLPKEKHQKFLTSFHKSPQDPKLLEQLKTDITDIEDQIQKTANKVKGELTAEIRRTTSR